MNFTKHCYIDFEISDQDWIDIVRFLFFSVKNLLSYKCTYINIFNHIKFINQLKNLFTQNISYINAEN